MADNQEKWDRLKITNPRLWKRRQETIDGIKEGIERVRRAREDASDETSMEERLDMARDLLGDLAGELEAHADGSVTVHLKTFH
jgi:hypothetical protein